MNSKKIAIAMFVDACGWRVVEPRSWFLQDMKHRQRLTSLFGYSSACVPAILTGRRPNENDHWSAFYYSPGTSPFRLLKHLEVLPASIFDRGRVRRYLSLAIAKAYGFTGYFQMYGLPFDVLSLYDYAEKKDIFRPGGINRGESIFDYIEKRGIAHHVSNWRHSEQRNVKELRAAVGEGEVQFAFLYTAGLDSLMHDYTKESPYVNDKLSEYQHAIEDVLRVARRKYKEVRFALFSDHGMATVETVVDLIPQVEATRLQFGVDYAAVYDSTMMRFWFLRPGSEAIIRAALPNNEQGRWITDEQHREFGTYWDNRRFGDAVYALEPGVLLNPSHMGKVALKGMHGYRPDHPDSDSALLANFTPEKKLTHITDLYDLMKSMAEWAQN